jgi:hypothetical protein
MTTADDEILCALPSIFGRHEAVPADMIGAVILRMGTITGTNVDGGGLVIDYQPRGSTPSKRIIFAFCETGMWVHSVETLPL